MTLVTLPFSTERFKDISADLEFITYVGEGDVPAETAFWVPPYGFAFDFARILPEMTNLEVIQTQSAGVEHIIKYVDPSVTLCNARGVHDAATSELGVALILASLRGLPRFVRAQDEGVWDADNMMTSLADRRVLIVGYGSIGQALERRLAGFEVDITRVARTARDDIHGFDELPALLPEAEIVVILAPLNDETRHLVDSAFLAGMKDGALLVNLARGGLVDTNALLEEVSDGRLFAALDVTEPEPLPADHPLWLQRNVLITPHVAGGTTAMKPRMQALLRDQLERFVKGQSLENQIKH